MSVYIRSPLVRFVLEKRADAHASMQKSAVKPESFLPIINKQDLYDYLDRKYNLAWLRNDLMTGAGVLTGAAVSPWGSKARGALAGLGGGLAGGLLGGLGAKLLGRDVDTGALAGTAIGGIGSGAAYGIYKRMQLKKAKERYLGKRANAHASMQKSAIMVHTPLPSGGAGEQELYDYLSRMSKLPFAERAGKVPGQLFGAMTRAFGAGVGGAAQGAYEGGKGFTSGVWEGLGPGLRNVSMAGAGALTGATVSPWGSKTRGAAAGLGGGVAGGLLGGLGAKLLGGDVNTGALAGTAIGGIGSGAAYGIYKQIRLKKAKERYARAMANMRPAIYRY